MALFSGEVFEVGSNRFVFHGCAEGVGTTGQDVVGGFEQVTNVVYAQEGVSVEVFEHGLVTYSGNREASRLGERSDLGMELWGYADGDDFGGAEGLDWFHGWFLNK